MNMMTLLFVAIVIILISHTYSGCCNNPYALIEGLDMATTTDKEDEEDEEGFTGANTNYGESSSFDLTQNPAVNTSTWGQPSLVITPGQPLNPAVKAFLSRPKQQIPLPEGQLDMFANTPFTPACCPNTFSNSQGCACMTGEQYNYLINRGGNNVPYSEY
jgi:hypothetical protein